MMTNATACWTQENELEDALSLPTGRWYAHVFGMAVEQSVKPRYVNEAVEGLKNAGIEVKAFSQAEIIVKAEKAKVAFQGWPGDNFGLL